MSSVDNGDRNRNRVVLYWLPLGAGGHSVRWNGRVFEAIVAKHEHRPTRDIYHAALEVWLRGDRYVVEMGPAWGSSAADRGVVLAGPVGAVWLGHSRFFRYEIRRWRNGVIPDLSEAVDSPQVLSREESRARRLLDLVPRVPAATWGRDELDTGEMWNSNSMVAWLLANTGHPTDTIAPPPNGRAPGWDAGLVVASRQRGRATVPGASISAKGTGPAPVSPAP